MEESTRLRVRAVLSSWLTVLLVVAVVAGAVGAWATYTAHVAPGTTTEQRTTEVWSATAAFDHSATVTRQNPVFPVGTELTNRSTYFRSAAPVVNGTFTVAPQGLGGNVSVDLAATLVLESADEETTYWTDTSPINETSASDADGPVSLAFSLTVTEVSRRITTIQQGIGSTPGETTAAVVVDARVSGTADGEASSLAFSRSLSLGLNGDTYAVSSSGPASEAVERTTTVRVAQTYGPVRSLGGPLALLVGAVAAGGLAYASRSGDLALDDAERARLDYLDDREEFDQWIVSVELPVRDPDRPVATAATLADLVNLAIDSDAAVLESPDGEAFAVVTDGYRYRYHPPPPSDDGLPSARFGSDGAAAGDRGGEASGEERSSEPADGSGTPAAAADGDGGPGE